MVTRTLKSLSLRKLYNVIGLNSIIVACLAIASTYLSLRFNYIIDFPLTILSIAVVFPIVFSIASAYKRREVALNHYASLKTHSRSVFYASRDWISDDKKESLKHQEKIKDLLTNILSTSKSIFQSKLTKNSAKLTKIYTLFSSLSSEIEYLRSRGMPTGEVSRCNQFFGKMMLSFENLKHISQYRTPVQLRTYSRFFTYLLPIVYGPYFANLVSDLPMGVFTFIMPVLFSVILVSLANMQNDLEDPFDQVGTDDIKIHPKKFRETLDL